MAKATKRQNVKSQRENLQLEWKQETGSSNATGGQGGGEEGGKAKAGKAYLETVQLLDWRGGGVQEEGFGGWGRGRKQKRREGLAFNGQSLGEKNN